MMLQLSKQEAAELFEKTLLCFLKLIISLLLRRLSFSLPPLWDDTVEPPTWSFHPCLHALHLSPSHSPLASLLLPPFLSSPLPLLSPVLLLKMTRVAPSKRRRSSCPRSLSVISFDAQVSPPGVSPPGFYLTLRYRAAAEGTTLCSKPSEFACGTLWGCIFIFPKISAYAFVAASLSECKKKSKCASVFLCLHSPSVMQTSLFQWR